MATASRSKLFCDQVITDKDEDKGQQEVHELSLNVCRLQGYRLLFFLLFSFSFPFFFLGGITGIHHSASISHQTLQNGAALHSQES